MKYYENWFKDEEGTKYDSYHTDYPNIKYKGADLDEVGTTDFEYKTINGGRQSIGLTIDKDGYVKASGSGGNGTILSEDNEITFIINGMEKKSELY